MLGTPADGVTNERTVDGRPAEVGQGTPERDLEVAHGIDQGAVEVDDGRVDVAAQQPQGRQGVRGWGTHGLSRGWLA